MQNQKSQQVIEINKEDESIFAGLFAFDSIATTQMITAPQIDEYLRISVYSFAIAIPLLAILLFIKRGERLRQTSYSSITLLVAYVSSTIISLLGIGGIFFHFSFLAGICFTISAIVGTILWVKFLRWRKREV